MVICCGPGVMIRRSERRPAAGRHFGLLAVLLLLLTMPAAAQTRFDEVLAGARREGAIEIWLASPSSGRVQQALLDAFQRRFGITTHWQWVGLHSMRAASRLVAEGAVGRVSADIVTSSADNVTKLVEHGLFRPYPWTDVFDAALPGIREPVERVLPELNGLCLAWFDSVYGIAWNTKFVTAAEAPRRFRDLLDPKWRGRFAINALGGAPFDLLSLGIGAPDTLGLVRGLLANRPVLKSGTPAVGSAITTGEAHLGISAFITVERARRNGEPQEFRFADDYVPVLPLYVCVPEHAPHLNTARLFAAWLVTEGIPIVEQMDATGRISAPDSDLAKALKTMPPTAHILQEQSLADVAKVRAIASQLGILFTGRRE
jgi:iron(III) transport system substrate-binding protein